MMRFYLCILTLFAASIVHDNQTHACSPNFNAIDNKFVFAALQHDALNRSILTAKKIEQIGGYAMAHSELNPTRKYPNGSSVAGCSRGWQARYKFTFTDGTTATVEVVDTQDGPSVTTIEHN